MNLADDLDAVAGGLDAVRAHLGLHGVGERCAYNAELVFEELFTNVVRHGFRGERGHRVTMEVRVETDDVVLELVDDGQPFDPTRYDSRPPAARLQEAAINGYGLQLVRKASRSFEYARRDGRNVVRVTLARED